MNIEKSDKSWGKIKEISDMIPKLQRKRPIHDKVISDTLRELFTLIDLLEKRVSELEREQ